MNEEFGCGWTEWVFVGSDRCEEGRQDGVWPCKSESIEADRVGGVGLRVLVQKVARAI